MGAYRDGLKRNKVLRRWAELDARRPETTIEETRAQGIRPLATLQEWSEWNYLNIVTAKLRRKLMDDEGYDESAKQRQLSGDAKAYPREKPKPTRARL